MLFFQARMAPLSQSYSTTLQRGLDQALCQVQELGAYNVGTHTPDNVTPVYTAAALLVHTTVSSDMHLLLLMLNFLPVAEWRCPQQRHGTADRNNATGK
jgi:hypothetical protein